MAVTLDERIDHQSHLIQTDMNGGVRNLAVALFFSILRRASAKPYMALKWDAVVGQFGQDFSSGRCTDVAVVLKPGCQHGFVIRHQGLNIAAQFGQDAGERLRAQAAVTFGQAGIGDFFCAVFINAGFILQPAHQLGFVFFLDQLQHDAILLSLVKIKPSFAKTAVIAQDRTGHITLKFLALRVFKIELHGTAGAQQFLDLREAAFAVLLQG